MSGSGGPYTTANSVNTGSGNGGNSGDSGGNTVNDSDIIGGTGTVDGGLSDGRGSGYG